MRSERSLQLEELAYATQMSLRSGQLEASKIVKEMTSSTPSRSRSKENEVEILSGEEALAMIIDAKLSRHQYIIVRFKDKMRFPPHERVLKAKQECYPIEIILLSPPLVLK